MLKDNDSDIVVMGCRGHMKVKQYLGSVSDVVLKDCKAAAIILKEIVDDTEVEHNPTGKAGMWPYVGADFKNK